MSIVIETSTNGCGSELSSCSGIKCVENFGDNVKFTSTERIDHITDLHPISKLQNGCLDVRSLSPSADIFANDLSTIETCGNSSITVVNGSSDKTNTKHTESSSDVIVENSLSCKFNSNEHQSVEINGMCGISKSTKFGSIESACIKNELLLNSPDTAAVDELVSCQINNSNHANEPLLKIVSDVSCAEEPSPKMLAIASKHSLSQIEGTGDENKLSMQPSALEHRQSSCLSSSSKSSSIQPMLQQPSNMTLSSPSSTMLVHPDGCSFMLSKSNANQPASRELIRPVAKLLQDTGLLLASEQVFKNLVKLQRNKVKRNMPSTVADRRLLEKLKSSHSTLACRNADFAIESLKHCYCGFQSESSNVLCLHQQCGEWGPGKCCMCDGKFAYRTRVQFERHVDVVHKQTVHRITRPSNYSCDLCPTDLGSQSLMKLHEKVCKRNFMLAKNLSPHVNHEDIPLKPRVLQKPGVPSNPDVTIVVNLPDKKQTSSSVLLTNKVPANSSGGIVLLPPFKPTVTIPAVSKPNVVNLSIKKPNSQTSSGSTKQISKTSERLPNVRTERTLSAVSIVGPSGDRIKKTNAGCVICPACGGFVRDEAALEIHMRVVHSLLSSVEMTVCWMCHDRSPVATHQLLSHLADRHSVTMATMLQSRQCSLCSTVPKMRNVSAFEVHMLSTHPTLFVSAEQLWQIIENLTPRSHHIHPAPDGTLKCQICSSNFISRSFLCRHAFLAHSGSACDCSVCMRVAAGVNLPQRPDSASAVVISDEEEEDDVLTRKRFKLNRDEQLDAWPIEHVRSIKHERSIQDLIAQDGSLMDKVEEILEIDGETVLIVQEADYDEDDENPY